MPLPKPIDTVGNGKIFIWDLERAVRIRRGEIDAAAT
jgi:nitrogen regulatory protein PII